MGMHRVAHRVSARTAATIASYRGIEDGVAERSPARDDGLGRQKVGTALRR